MHSGSSSSAEMLQASAVSPPSRGQFNWLIGLSTVIILAGGGFALWRIAIGRNRPSEMPMPGAVPVTLEQLQPSTIREQAEFVGILDAQTGVVLQPESAGRITRIYVSSGDPVSAGDPIMELSADRSLAEVNAAIAGISAARSARDTARAQLQSLVAQRLRQEAEVELQNTEFERTRRLVEAGALSQQSLDTVDRDRDVAIAALQAAKEEIAAARASVAQAESFLAQAEANANATREDLQDRTVTAPISGILGDITVDLGDYVEFSSSLTSITQNDVLDLEIAVPTERARTIQIGMPVELLTFDTGESAATATVNFIDPQSDPNTQTVLAKAEVANASGRLQDNQRVDVRVVLSERSGLLAPATAITRLGGQAFVYVAVDAPSLEADPSATSEGNPSNAEEGGPQQASQQIAQLRPVSLGAMQGNRFQILEGLSEGEVIVTSGLLNLQDGTPIVSQSEGATSHLLTAEEPDVLREADKP